MFWNPLLTLGSGVGIEIRGEDLSVALVRSRWKGVTVAGHTLLRDFRRRPAAEWGEEYHAFLRSHGFRELAATLALPRSEVMVRLLSLPAVAAGADLASAVRFQIDSLHPYGEDNVYYSFSPLGGSGTAEVAVVLAPRPGVDGYADLFEEAGVKLRAMTVAAAGYYGASRLIRRRPPEPFLLVDRYDSTFELYGESETRPFFSAAFDSRVMPLEKAVAAAAAELRSVEQPASVEQTLGSPLQAPEEFHLSRDASAFVTALAAACPRWGWRANLLPPARRSSSSRWPLAATAAAAVAVAAVALSLWVRGPVQDARYARELARQIKLLEAVERETRGLERQAQKARARREQLEAFRRRAESDVALVTEISRRLPKSVWLNSMEITEDSVQLGGQAEAAAPLLGLLDSSGVLTGSSFAGSITRNENREGFRIRAARRAQAVPRPVSPPAPHAGGHTGN
ncbi:MAG: PilN domain-containing protein [Acidobacteria bacterium]|nr:PilN domain-containing protein [Acidobacteriota bacterium]